MMYSREASSKCPYFIKNGKVVIDGLKFSVLSESNDRK